MHATDTVSASVIAPAPSHGDWRARLAAWLARMETRRQRSAQAWVATYVSDRLTGAGRPPPSRTGDHRLRVAARRFAG